MGIIVVAVTAVASASLAVVLALSANLIILAGLKQIPVHLRVVIIHYCFWGCFLK